LYSAIQPSLRNRRDCYAPVARDIVKEVKPGTKGFSAKYGEPLLFQGVSKMREQAAAMRIHHLNCGTMCPLGGRLWDGVSAVLRPATIVCHCLLIETEAGLVLVDTGFGLADVHNPRRLSPLFRVANRIRLREAETAIRQIEARGFAATDVRHIVLTHLDFDHAGGIGDFPRASVHVLDRELAAAKLQTSPGDRRRYRPDGWDRAVTWQTYTLDGERWFGFRCVRDLVGLPPDILLVPLAGHTLGHCGVAVRTGEGWLLHAGDAYFFRGEMDLGEYYCTPMLRLYQRMLAADNAARLNNQERLRRLKQSHGRDIRLFCAHDAKELEMFAAATAPTVQVRAPARHSTEPV
jgi:glyoxylase-like metal-dependent hydrolase (beta-lactamase superfamily II)